MAYRYETITDFRDNAIGMDPADCGCVDCIVGSSFPEGTFTQDALFDIAMLNRPLIVRTSGTVEVKIVYSDSSYEMIVTPYDQTPTNTVVYRKVHD